MSPIFRASYVGRFATQYHARYGESPSATLCRNQKKVVGGAGRVLLSRAVERPAIAVLPFDVIGQSAWRAVGIAEEIAVALMRVRWFVVVVPAKASYHLRGTVRDDGKV